MSNYLVGVFTGVAFTRAAYVNWPLLRTFPSVVAAIFRGDDETAWAIFAAAVKETEGQS